MTGAERPAGQHNTLYGIQYLRAFAALAVVVFHAAERSGFAFAIGAAGVDVFFVISGFIMWVIVERRPVSPGRFLIDRIRRIVPIYWLATALMVAGGLAGLFPNLVLTAGHVLASFFFVPLPSPSSGGLWPVLVQGWTLNYEMFFYVVFAACLALPRSFLLPAMVLVFVGLVAIGFAVESSNPLIVTYTRPIILEFVAGMLIGRLWLAGWVPNAFASLVLIVGALVGFALIGILRLPFDEWTCGPLACALVYGTAALETRGRVPRLRLPAVLGDASYSIYLWHTFAISVVAKAGMMLGLASWLVLLASFLVGTLAGLCGYYLIERPLLRGAGGMLKSRNMPA
ncbi:acyltransferase family protein [Shinella kummerowiae]|jgi:exopolysaccharide production protein ExoZ|uniref:Acyltransferase family protein n=1 Tax=Shinella kummerowiae TaxID=417745 RepID=A0A6N8SGW2_9HYPH|nr:acyltransferase [Shinella kummerowiae]MXN46536.1 acyltransferase family protein [Shinella kummerowiae]